MSWLCRSANKTNSAADALWQRGETLTNTSMESHSGTPTLLLHACSWNNKVGVKHRLIIMIWAHFVLLFTTHSVYGKLNLDTYGTSGCKKWPFVQQLCSFSLHPVPPRPALYKASLCHTGPSPSAAEGAAQFVTKTFILLDNFTSQRDVWSWGD